MLVVLPYCQKDRALACKLLQWMIELDGRQENHRLILMASNPCTKAENTEVMRLGIKAFGNTVMYRQILPDERGHPFSANTLFRNTCDIIAKEIKRPFLWLEPDATPLRKSWLDLIESEYRSNGKPFMGTLGVPEDHLNGNAVYPANAIDYREMFVNKPVPFDCLGGQRVLFNAAITSLIQHRWSIDNQPKSNPHTFNGPSSLRVISPEAVIFHRCKDGSLIDSLRGNHKYNPEQSTLKDALLSTLGKIVEHISVAPTATTHTPVKDKVFYHSGDLGDIVYAMPLIKHLSGGIVHIGPAGEFPTRESMTRARANLIIPLLKQQPYIQDALFVDKMQPGSYSLNSFRSLFRSTVIEKYYHYTLAQMQLEYSGAPQWVQNDKWIFVGIRKPPQPVIIARSPRYHNDEFDWPRIMDKYGKHSCFVGTKEEYDDFTRNFGLLPYLPTANLLDLAEYISGSELFIGNQSCPFAIAEGLKHQAILEFAKPMQQNCHFCRTNLYYGTANSLLPDVGRKPKLNWHVLTDLHSGLGRCAESFYRHVSQHYDVTWIPTRKTDEFTQLPAGRQFNCRKVDGPTFTLEATNLLGRYVGNGDIVFAMWESTRLPPDSVTALNRAKTVIVPSEWCRDSFRESGVKPYIYKVPLGVDCDLYRVLPTRKAGDILRIGCACRQVDNGNPRKNLDMIVAGFIQAFRGSKNVKLCIKVYDCQVPYRNELIEVSEGFWSDRQMVEWYNTLDAFVNLSSGGGWELHLHEAMACGAVPICLHYSSQTEFVNPQVGYMVDHTLITPTWGDYANLGQWAQPVFDHYVEVLRHIQENRNELQAKRPKAIAAANKFPHYQSGTELVRVLKEIL